MTENLSRLVLGVQPVREVLRVHGTQVRELLLQQGSKRTLGVQRAAEQLGVSIQWVTRSQLDKVAQGVMHQGAAVFAPELQLTALPQVLKQHSLVLALDGIVDPQNFGAVVRSAVGIAQAAVVWGENASAPLTPATFRASAGAIEHACLCRVPSLKQAILDAQLSGFDVLVLDAHAEHTLRQKSLKQPTLIVLGSEGAGVSRGVKKLATAVRLIDMHAVDSLNASVAAALALYEAQSQRSKLSQQD